MSLATSTVLRLGVALGIGLLIGAERERRKGLGSLRGSAGIRTFTVVSVAGAVSQLLGGTPLIAVAAAGVAVLAALSYLRTRQQDPGMTTESALLLTLLLGALAMRDAAIASAVAVVLAVLLASRTRLHHFVRTVLTEDELHDALIFAAAVTVVLPLVPDRYVGPFAAINPRAIWKIVVLLMSVGALGHVAVRAMGPKVGLPLAGLASGFASSSATIASMGALARKQPDLAWPAISAAVLSSVATIVELVIVLEVTSPPLLGVIRWSLFCAGAATILCGTIFTLKTLKRDVPQTTSPGSAFSLKVTLILAATVTAVTFLSALVNAKLGSKGVMGAAAIAGFGDAHSAAVSVASLAAAGKMTVHDAGLAVFAAVTSNTITKAVLAFTSGGISFASRVLPGLILMVVGLWVPFLF